MARKQIELFRHKVTSVKEVAEGYYMLFFGRQFNFQAGQVVALAINHNHDPRLYSIATSESSDEMGILFDIKPDGFLTPQLALLENGAEILVSKPFGEFVSTNEHQWWIATGTGIAPFLSMLSSGKKLPDKFLHGARYLNQFLFSDLFEDKLNSDYLRFCTQEEADDVYHQRLSEWIGDQKVLPEQIKYYLCGNPNMVVDVRDLILSKGVKFENVMAEIYF